LGSGATKEDVTLSTPPDHTSDGTHVEKKEEEGVVEEGSQFREKNIVPE